MLYLAPIAKAHLLTSVVVADHMFLFCSCSCISLQDSANNCSTVKISLQPTTVPLQCATTVTHTSNNYEPLPCAAMKAFSFPLYPWRKKLVKNDF